MKLAGIRKALLPTEEAEQRALALWLDWHKILWCHVPNGGERSKAVAGKLKAAGARRRAAGGAWTCGTRSSNCAGSGTG